MNNPPKTPASTAQEMICVSKSFSRYCESHASTSALKSSNVGSCSSGEELPSLEDEEELSSLDEDEPSSICSSEDDGATTLVLGSFSTTLSLGWLVGTSSPLAIAPANNANLKMFIRLFSFILHA